MQTRVLEPLGIEITDLDLSDPPVEELRRLLARHGVVVLRDQDLDDDGFERFLRAFGDLVFTEGETPVEGHPDLNVVSNVGRTTPPRSVFHVDTSYVEEPPAYTALRAVTVPREGGQTLFTDQYAAYDSLEQDLRTVLEGRDIRHIEAWHPAFRRHPISGRTSLYISTPERCVEVRGLSRVTGRNVIEVLYEHSTQGAPTLRHAWRAGDVVMWDNGCVLHKADHSGVVGDRVLHRGMVAGYGAR